LLRAGTYTPRLPAGGGTATQPGELSAQAGAGEGLVVLGAGRRTRTEAVDHGAGLLVHARLGDRLEAGQPLATLLVGDRPVDDELLTRRTEVAFEISAEPAEPPSLILGTVDEIVSEEAPTADPENSVGPPAEPGIFSP